MSDAPARIGVLDVAGHAFRTLARDLPAIGRLGVPLLVPVLFAHVAMMLLYSMTDLAGLVAAIVTMACFAQIAVNLMRFQLLGPAGVAGGPFEIGKRTAIFVAYAIGAWVVAGAAIGVGAMSAMPLFLSRDSMLEAIAVAMVVGAVLFAVWLVLRLSLVLPEAALDRTPSLGLSWRRTRGNSIRIAAIVVLTQIPMAIAAAILMDVARGLSFGNAIVVAAIQLGLTLLAIALGVAALGEIYRRLGGQTA